MVSKSILVSKLTPYLGTKKVLIYNQSTNDIIEELLKAHKLYESDYNKIYKYFEAGTINQTLKNLFDFCKKNISYNIESGDKQSLKSPAAILIQGYGDCKQYSQFIGGVLGAMCRNNKNINWCYRFSAYNEKKEIQHVFIVVKIGNSEIWCDPVLNYLNERKQYNFKKDKTMPLYQISGFENEEEQIGRLRIKLPKIKIAKAIKQISIKNVKNLALKVGLAPSRNAFLGLVSVNALGLAKKIAKGILKDRSKVERLWRDLGGDFKALLRAVNNRQSEFKVSGYGSIGDPATGTAAAAAAPVLAAVLKLLKEMGIDTKDLAGSVSKLAQKEAVKLIENKGKDIIQNGFKSVLKTKEDGTPVVEMTPTGEAPVFENQNTTLPATGTEAKKNNTLLIVGGAAVALYFLTKKR